MNLSFLLAIPEDISLAASKAIKLKKNIIKRIILEGEATIAELSKETEFSVPTVTKAISELVDDEIICNVGEDVKVGGRKPKKFGIKADACFYLGVEVTRDSVTLGMQDFRNRFVSLAENVLYTLENTQESLDSLCNIINDFIKDTEINRQKIVGACINLSGRINSREGVSYNYFNFKKKPLSEVIESKIHVKTFLENDSRAMAYGEYNSGVVQKEKNVIFVNLCWGIGTGIITNGHLFYGHSGYSGEFGHSPVFDNEIICQCGKKGCLETEVSGTALLRKFKEALNNGSKSILSELKPVGEIQLSEILKAINEDDTLAIEVIHEMGNVLGRYLSILINIFNPELVVLGGTLSGAGTHILLPVKTTVQKYSLSLVNQNMELKLSTLGSTAGINGACYILRDKLLDII